MIEEKELLELFQIEELVKRYEMKVWDIFLEPIFEPYDDPPCDEHPDCN